MSNFSTWLIAIFMVMYWLFRAIVTLCTQFSIDLLGLTSINFEGEVIISFVTLLCIVLVVKRKAIGSILYLFIYGGFYGQHFFTTIMPLIKGESSLAIDSSLALISDLLAILLALFALIDMLADKGRKINPSDGKTDWYFKNKKYEEELKARDQREDSNEYKFY